jgi:hypothetical protein
MTWLLPLNCNQEIRSACNHGSALDLAQLIFPSCQKC